MEIVYLSKEKRGICLTQSIKEGILDLFLVALFFHSCMDNSCCYISVWTGKLSGDQKAALKSKSDMHEISLYVGAASSLVVCSENNLAYVTSRCSKKKAEETLDFEIILKALNGARKDIERGMTDGC